MSEDDRQAWAGEGMLDRIRFVCEMEMYHGAGAVHVLSKDFSPQLTAEDVKKMKEREDVARHIAACTFLKIIEQKKKRKEDAAIVSPAKKLPSVASSTTTSADIATIATPTSSNTSGGPKSFGGTACAAPALIELSSDSSFSDEDPDEAFI